LFKKNLLSTEKSHHFVTAKNIFCAKYPTFLQIKGWQKKKSVSAGKGDCEKFYNRKK